MFAGETTSKPNGVRRGRDSFFFLAGQKDANIRLKYHEEGLGSSRKTSDGYEFLERFA